LEGPRLEGAADGPAVWTVQVPAGYQAAAPAAATAGAAALDLRRAEAQLRLSEVLADQARARGDGPAAQVLADQLAAAQKRFYHFLGHAGHGLALAPESASDPGPGGQTLAGWLQALGEQDRQLAHDQGFEPVRAEAEREARAAGADCDFSVAGPGEEAGPSEPAAPRAGGLLGSPLPERGTPRYWQADAGAPAPTLELVSAHGRQERRALAASLLLLVLLL